MSEWKEARNILLVLLVLLTIGMAMKGVGSMLAPSTCTLDGVEVECIPNDEPPCRLGRDC